MKSLRITQIESWLDSINDYGCGDGEYWVPTREAFEWVCREALKSLSAPPEVGAIGEVAAERQRQKDKEGWSEEHDDGHPAGQLAAAGGSYAIHAALQAEGFAVSKVPSTWPWDFEWWKPKDQRRNLIRAAALIVAEIERMDRCASSPPRDTMAESIAKQIENGAPGDSQSNR